MPRKLIIFGNGLGRSLSNDYFRLDAAMASVWNDAGCLEQAQRDLISTAIEGIDGENGPSCEDDLLGTQLALIGIRLLKTATHDDALAQWLTPDAQAFPAALRRYTYQVAKYFHKYPSELVDTKQWRDFINSLVKFIFDSKSHVATLNYDTLLYAPFNEVQVIGDERIKLCNGFRGTLLDGYTNGLGFTSDNMKRTYAPESKSFYMHLHGSPLFVDDESSRPTKLRRSALQDHEGDKRAHVVLTSGEMKPSVIAASPVLQMYWSHLPQAIEEASEIILFGYSGGDIHLNKLLKAERGDRVVKVVERVHEDDRERYWSVKLGEDNHIVHLDNILDFRSWDD